MPVTAFDQLPGSARVWVFGSSRALSAEESSQLLGTVDEFLAEWRAHGLPLTAARDWRHERFLTVAVDQRDAHASGCSIDGLYRSLRAVEQQLGTRLLGGGRLFYRDAGGVVHCVDRAGFAELAKRGEVDAGTPVFDLTVTDRAGWLERFEAPAADSWHREVLQASAT